MFLVLKFRVKLLLVPQIEKKNILVLKFQNIYFQSLKPNDILHKW